MSFVSVDSSAMSIRTGIRDKCTQPSVLVTDYRNWCLLVNETMNLVKVFGWIVIFTTILRLLLAGIEPVKEIHVSTEELVKKRQGILSTFDLNVSSQNVKITWSFTLPKDAVLTLRMKKLKFHFQMEPRCPSCCPENALYVPNNYQGQHVYCATSVFETLTVIENNFLITFVSEYVSQGVELEFFVRRKTEACSKHSLQCFDEKGCYSINKICDGEFDCEDHTDEQNCSKCRANYTMCNNEDRAVVEHRNCFHPELHRCDGIFQCRTGEDELNCVDECKHQIQCADKTGCYSLYQRCDAIFNCKDHSDEANCHSIKCEVLSNTSDYFACKNGWCIRKFQVSDGKPDCDDGSDETSISVNTFAIMFFIYILLIVSLVWMAIMWCTGMYRGHTNLKTPQLQRETSFMYNYKIEPPKRNAASQISGPIPSPVPSRCLKPLGSTLTNSTSTLSLPLYETIDSSPTSMQSVTTICKSYDDTPPESLNVIHHSVNPSAAENIPEIKVHTNDLKIVRNNIHTKSGSTPKTVQRLKTYEFWI